MNKYFIIGLSSIVFFIACMGEKAEFTTAGANFFGEKISDAGSTSLAEINLPEAPADTLDVLLRGKINEVCQAKGCWMTFESADSDKFVFVKFKNYGFFVPKDAGGKDVVIRGKLYSNITSVEELRHYAEDKGASSEEIAAIIEPAKELRMMADGVIIYNN